MRFEAVAIKDITKAPGLSTSTMSRDPRDSYGMSPEIKKPGPDYAARINYHPHLIALGLKERRTCSIGIIIKQPALKRAKSLLPPITTDESKRPVKDFETKMLAPQVITRNSTRNKIMILKELTYVFPLRAVKEREYNLPQNTGFSAGGLYLQPCF